MGCFRYFVFELSRGNLFSFLTAEDTRVHALMVFFAVLSIHGSEIHVHANGTN